MYEFMKTILSALQTWVNKRIKSNAPNWNENNSEADGYIKNRPFYTDGDQVVQIDKKYLPDSFHVQPDFAQNDKKSFDYIKNRTHYYDKKLFVATWIDNVTFTGFENGYYGTGDSGLGGVYDENWYWNSDSEYTVIWDGVEYSGLTRHNDALGGNGYPFTIYLYEYLDIYTSDAGESHTVTVIEYGDAHTVEIPSTALNNGSTYIYTTESLPEVHEGFTYHLEGTLKAVYSGVEYNTAISEDCVCYADGIIYPDTKLTITAAGKDVYFGYIRCANYSSTSRIRLYCYVTGVTAEATFTISRGIKKLDEAFLPHIPDVDTTLSIEGAAADAKTVGELVPNGEEVDVVFSEPLNTGELYYGIKDCAPVPIGMASKSFVEGTNFCRFVFSDANKNIFITITERSGYLGHRISLWKIVRGIPNLIKTYHSSGDDCFKAIYSPQHSLLTVCCDENYVHIYKIGSSSITKQASILVKDGWLNSGRGTSMILSSDGSLLGFYFYEVTTGYLRIYSTLNGSLACPAIYGTDIGNIASMKLAISQDNSMIIVSGIKNGTNISIVYQIAESGLTQVSVNTDYRLLADVQNDLWIGCHSFDSGMSLLTVSHGSLIPIDTYYNEKYEAYKAIEVSSDGKIFFVQYTASDGEGIDAYAVIDNAIVFVGQIYFSSTIHGATMNCCFSSDNKTFNVLFSGCGYYGKIADNKITKMATFAHTLVEDSLYYTVDQVFCSNDSEYLVLGFNNSSTQLLNVYAQDYYLASKTLQNNENYCILRMSKNTIIPSYAKYGFDTASAILKDVDRTIVDPTLTIEGGAAEAKAVGNALIDLKEQIDLGFTVAKGYIPLMDQVNGYTYLISMRDGNLVSSACTKFIEIVTMPTKLEYIHGEYLDISGMNVMAICCDGTTKEITDYTYPAFYLTEGTTYVEISYVEAGIIHTATIPVTVNAFDAAMILADFTYTDNGDGTYTITGWNGTYNGEPSTEMIIPNYGCIIV